MQLIKLLFLFIVIGLFHQSCSTTSSKIDKINSKLDVHDSFKISTKNKNSSNKDKFNEFLKNQDPSEFIDSIKQKLIIEKEVLVDIKYRNLVDQISFPNVQDTIYLSKIKIKSPTGGIPIIYEYNVKKNDIVFYNFQNSSIFNLKNISILEGKSTRFEHENFRKKDKLKGSFISTSDNVITVVINNDNFIKNLGLFKSKLNIEIKTLGTLKLKSQIITDTVFSAKKIEESVYDTIFNIESQSDFILASKLNLSEKSKLQVPVFINEDKNLIAWMYWFGLNQNDTLISASEEDNFLSKFAKNELNNISNNYSSLISKNDDINVSINNFTLDRRSLNFSKNFSLYKVDNNYSEKNKNKAEITLQNTSKLYDYNIRFVSFSVSLKESKKEVEKEIGEIKKYIKLNLEYDE
tara:strand:+ start:704 stop:1924 length:1221 start_codon:yes stop_codon:yes gene_type:complete